MVDMVYNDRRLVDGVRIIFSVFIENMKLPEAQVGRGTSLTPT